MSTHSFTVAKGAKTISLAGSDYLVLKMDRFRASLFAQQLVRFSEQNDPLPAEVEFKFFGALEKIDDIDHQAQGVPGILS